MRLHDLLVRYYLRGDKSPDMRQQLWDEVDNLISQLERKQFGQNTKQQMHVDRVLSFYDFFEQHVLPRGKTVAWGISTYRVRFVQVVETLRLRETGMVLCGASCGFNDSYVKNFVIPFMKARRNCRNVQDLDCLMSQWRNTGNRARNTLVKDIQTLNAFLNPQQLDEFSNGIETGSLSEV